jgi:dolichol-phosphate mannosyltransferase
LDIEFMIDVSIIVPVKNEEESIAALAKELDAAMNPNSWSWECVWVDDGSTDESLSVIETMAARDPHHRFISFERNAGQSAAFCAGFREARGRVLATIDGDGQNDPADIPTLVEMVLSGRADMANGYRQKRHDNLVRKVSSRIANGFRNLVTGKTVRDVGCSTRAFRRECAEDLPLFAGMHRFFPSLVAMRGFVLAEAPVNHRPRMGGMSKYGIGNRLWVGLMDTFGVWWLRRRAFSYKVSKRSGAEE